MRPGPYLRHLRLTITTTRTPTFTLTPQAAGTPTGTPLVLNGEALELRSVSIGDAPLAAGTDYELTEEVLYCYTIKLLYDYTTIRLYYYTTILHDYKTKRLLDY